MKNKILSIFLAITLFISIVPFNAFSVYADSTNTYYVKSTGSDSAAGTSAAPFATLDKAYAALNGKSGTIVVMDELNQWLLETAEGAYAVNTIALADGQTLTVTGKDPATGNVYTNASIARTKAGRTAISNGHLILEHITDNPFGGAWGSMFIRAEGAGSLTLGTGYNTTDPGIQVELSAGNGDIEVNVDGAVDIVRFVDWNSYNRTGDVTINIGKNANFYNPTAAISFGGDLSSNSVVNIDGNVFLNVDGATPTKGKILIGGYMGYTGGEKLSISGALQILLKETTMYTRFHDDAASTFETGNIYVVSVKDLPDGCDVVSTAPGYITVTTDAENDAYVNGVKVADGAIALTAENTEVTFSVAGVIPYTYYVSATGSDDNDGKTSAKPFATLDKAYASLNGATGTIVVMDELSKWLDETESAGRYVTNSLTLADGQTLTITGKDPATGSVYENAALTRNAGRVSVTNGHLVLEYITEKTSATLANDWSGMFIQARDDASLTLGAGYYTAKDGTEVEFDAGNGDIEFNLDGAVNIVRFVDYTGYNHTGNFTLNIGKNADFYNYNAAIALGGDFGDGTQVVNINGNIMINVDGAKPEGTKKIILGGYYSSTTGKLDVNGTVQILLKNTTMTAARHADAYTYEADNTYIITANNVPAGCDVVSKSAGVITITSSPAYKVYVDGKLVSGGDYTLKNEYTSIEWRSIDYVDVTGIKFNTPSAVCIIGQKTQIIADIIPENAGNIDVVWASSDDSVATVEGGTVTVISNGKTVTKPCVYVKALKLGTAKITATTVDGGYTAECLITTEKPGPLTTYVSPDGVISGVTETVYTTIEEAHKAIEDYSGVGTIFVEGEVFFPNKLTTKCSSINIESFSGNANDATVSFITKVENALISADNGAILTFDNITIKRNTVGNNEMWIGLDDIDLTFGSGCKYTNETENLHFGSSYAFSGDHTITINSASLAPSVIAPIGTWGVFNDISGNYTYNLNAGELSRLVLSAYNTGADSNYSDANVVTGNVTFNVDGAKVDTALIGGISEGRLEGTGIINFNSGSIAKLVTSTRGTSTKTGQFAPYVKNAAFIVNTKEIIASGNSPYVYYESGDLGTVDNFVHIVNNAELYQSSINISDANIKNLYNVKVAGGKATPKFTSNGVAISLTPDDVSSTVVYINGAIATPVDGLYIIQPGETNVVLNTPTVYVSSANGNDNGLGTAESPFASLAKAYSKIGTSSATIVVMDELNHWFDETEEAGEYSVNTISLAEKQTIKITGKAPFTDKIYENAALTRNACRIVIAKGTLILENIADKLSNGWTGANKFFKIKDSASLTLGSGYKRVDGIDQTGCEVEFHSGTGDVTFNLESMVDIVRFVDYEGYTHNGNFTINIGKNAEFKNNSAAISLGGDFGHETANVTINGNIFINVDRANPSDKNNILLGGYTSATTGKLNILGTVQILLKDTTMRVEEHDTVDTTYYAENTYIVNATDIANRCDVVSNKAGKIDITLVAPYVAEITDAYGTRIISQTTSNVPLRSKETEVNIHRELKTVYVSMSGNDSNNGLSSSTPFATFEKALAYIGNCNGTIVVTDNMDSWPFTPTITLLYDQTITVTGKDPVSGKIYNSSISRNKLDSLYGRTYLTKGNLVLEYIRDIYEGETQDKPSYIKVSEDATLTIGKGYIHTILANNKRVDRGIEVETGISYGTNISSPTINLYGNVTMFQLIDWENYTATGDITINVGESAYFHHSSRPSVILGGDDRDANETKVQILGSVFVNIEKNKQNGSVILGGTDENSYTTISGDVQILRKATNFKVVKDEDGEFSARNVYIVSSDYLPDNCDYYSTKAGEIYIDLDKNIQANVVAPDGSSTFITKSARYKLQPGETTIEFFINGCTVNLNGGSMNGFAFELNEDGTARFTNSPTKNQKAFEGWYSDKNLTKLIKDGDTIPYGTTLYAKYMSLSADYTAGKFVIVGAQIRVPNGEKIVQGLRFISTVQYDVLDKLAALSDKNNEKLKYKYGNPSGYGSVLLPEQFLSNHELLCDEQYEYNGVFYSSASAPAKKIYGDDTINGYIAYTACLTEIPETSYQTTYVARPYIKYYNRSGSLSTFYGEEYSASVMDITFAALENKRESADALYYLRNEILSSYIELNQLNENLLTQDVLQSINTKTEQYKTNIIGSANPTTAELSEYDIVYYVSTSGSDSNTGRSSSRPFKTIEKVNSVLASSTNANKKIAVLFKRGEMFRGRIIAKNNVLFSSYGNESLSKPIINGSPRNYGGDPSLWEETQYENVYRLTIPSEWTFNTGMMAFDHTVDEKGNYVYGVYNELMGDRRLANETYDGIVFKDESDLNKDLQFYSKMPDFINNRRNNRADNQLYLYSSAGNPGERFERIEIGNFGPGTITHLFNVANFDNVTIENLHLVYAGGHAIGGSGSLTTITKWDENGLPLEYTFGGCENLTVENCIIAWVGGSVNDYTTKEFPVVRFGNAIEIAGSVNGFYARDNWVYQIYDSGVTHQVSDTASGHVVMQNIEYSRNLIEYCVWSIEFYNHTPDPHSKFTQNVLTDSNIVLKTGFGWGADGRESSTTAFNSFGMSKNPLECKNIVTRNNIYVRSKGSLMRLYDNASERNFVFENNTYIQDYNKYFMYYYVNERPTIVYQDKNIANYVSNNPVFKETGAKVYYYVP